MRMPSHTTLTSFIFSAVLTSAFIPAPSDASLAAAGAPAVQAAIQSAMNGVRTQVFAGGAAVALPAPASTPAALPASGTTNQPLSPELLSKLLRLVAVKGTDREATAPFANALGLTPAGQGWPDRQIGANGADKIVHAFIVSRGTDQDVLLYISRPDSALIFRSQRDGKIVSALSFDKQTSALTIRNPDEAQKDLDSEFVFWANNVDTLLSGA